MKTTNSTLTSFFLALILSLALNPQAQAGGLLTSPSEEEETPPAVEQPAAAPEKKPDETPKAKDSDAKEKKTAKKKKQKEEKSDSPAVGSENKTDDASAKADVKQADKDKEKTAKKKKQKEEKPDSPEVGSENKTDDASAKADVKKTDKDKEKESKKAERKNKKSEEKTAEDKDSDAKKTDKAAEKNSDETKPGEKDANAPSTVLDGAKKAKSDVPLPKRLASFTCGAFLGYPVAMAKRTVHQTKAGNKDFIGESTNPIKVGIATMVSLPFGFVGGAFEGVQYTVYNSWKASGEEPFGKETFSLSDD